MTNFSIASGVLAKSQTTLKPATWHMEITVYVIVTSCPPTSWVYLVFNTEMISKLTFISLNCTGWLSWRWANMLDVFPCFAATFRPHVLHKGNHLRPAVPLLFFEPKIFPNLWLYPFRRGINCRQRFSFRHASPPCGYCLHQSAHSFYSAYFDEKTANAHSKNLHLDL